MRRLRQISALAALLAVLVGVPWAMAATIGNPLHAWSALKVGDLSATVVTDALAAVVWVAIWVAWAQFTVAMVAAIRSALRTAHSPAAGWAGPPPLQAARIPGEFTGIPQLARWLVATALLLGTAASAAAMPARAIAAGPAPAPVAAVAHLPASAPTAEPAAAVAAAPHAATHTLAAPAGTRVYVVPRDGAGPDTYWDIARVLLGNGQRWQEIWDLNRGRTQADGSIMSHAGLLLPGWTVLIPAQASTAAGSEVVPVVAGDNLTEIAEEHGSTEAAVWARNEGRVMSDGRVFTDPNLILPNDTIIIPGPDHTSPATPAHTRTTPRPAPPRHSRPGRIITAAPSSPPTPATPATRNGASPPLAASAHPAPSATRTHAGDRHEPAETSPAARAAPFPWAELFAGSGALLAAGLLGALVRRRRMSWRTARIGHTLAGTPPHLVPAEKATLTHGSAAAPDGQFLDCALRSLVYTTAAADGAALPDVLAARLTADELQLRLTEPHPSDPPAPWRVDESGLWWTVPVDVELPISTGNADQAAAPYPTLVGVGYLGTDDLGAGPGAEPDEPAAASEKWLVDLERAGAVALTGDQQRCLDLGRFIAAGLAVNDWSQHVTVTMVGFGAELVPINPARLRHTEDLDTAAALLRADFEHASTAAANADMGVLAARLHAVALDSFMPHVLLVAPHIAAEQDRLGQLLAQLADRPERASVAIVLAGERGDVPAAGWVLHVSGDGHLTLPGLALEVTAQRLPCEQAEGIAQMLHRAGAGQEQRVPPASGDRPWEQFCDAAGSLRPEFSLPRTPDTRAGPVLVASVSGPADLPNAGRLVAAADESRTLLPADDQAYLAAAATTTEDLQVVAPRVPVELSARVAESLGDLDARLAMWRDPDCPLPRLTVLGPVELRAHGPVPQRVPYYTELAAYLASRDHGAQLDQIAEAFGVKNETAASRLKDLRAWLGVNRRTGEMHLPDARKSRASRERGVSVYEIEDLLVDADLFQQLHLRAQTRGGAEGIADLEAALELVIGEPYSQRRAGGYAWLRDNPVDEYLNVAVEKVAHTVANWALEQGEPDRAERAARTALHAMPFAEVPRLDLAAVLEARGSKAAAERLLRDEVCNRDDDGSGPMDLSDRTEQIRRRRAWLSAAS